MPSRGSHSLARLPRTAGALGLLGLGFLMAHLGGLPLVTAEPAPESEYGKRVVAYIHGNQPITREDLGEFLIARYGAEKLNLLVNRRIIEHACTQQNVVVTAEEVEAALQQDLKELGVNKTDFVNVVLKNYGKSLYEWEQDVIRPRLLLGKLCRDRIEVTEEDLHKMFDHLYGEKVSCRLIMWSVGRERDAQRVYGEIRESEEAFAREARNQEDPNLAAAGGQIAPIARHSLGTSNLLEQEAFQLQPGELSRIITTPQGVIVLKCDARIPARTDKDFATEREALEKELINRKIQAEIPVLFESLQTAANPQLFLPGATDKPGALERSVEQELTTPE